MTTEWAERAFAAASEGERSDPSRRADEGSSASGGPFVALARLVAEASEQAGIWGLAGAYEGFGRAFSPLPLLSCGVLAAARTDTDLARPRGLAVEALGDADAAAGVWTIRAKAELVIDAPSAEELLVATPEGAFLIAKTAPGVELEELAAFDPVRRIARCTFDRVLADRIELGPDGEEVAWMRSRLEALLAAEAVGIADWAIRVGAAYARERRAFGRPIGSNQAVAHPLADSFSALVAARSLLRWALTACERAHPVFSLAASLARVVAARTAVEACERSIQVHGALGYRWDRGIHLRLRRAETTRTLAGGPAVVHRRLVEALRADQRLPGVELLDDEEQAEIRERAAAWAARNLPAEHRGLAAVENVQKYVDFASTWATTVTAAGWPTLHWPAEHGGAGRRASLAAIAVEEVTRLHPRRWPQRVGLELVAPSLMLHGTAEQQRRFLPGIKDGSILWTQGYSEPGAGTDLAALGTRATREGPDWRLDGEKIWSAPPTLANRYFLLARTGAPDSRHRGITCFLVDLEAPGIERETIRSIAGQHEFGRAVLSSVRVPDEDRLGEVDGGWQLVMDQLRDERTITVFAETAIVDFMFERLLETIELLGPGAWRRDDLVGQVAEAWIDLQALRIVNRQTVEAIERGEDSVEAEAAKLLWSRLGQRIAALGLESLGERGTVGGGDGAPAEYWRFVRMETRCYTIYAGTTEILLSLLAESALDLPRSR
ncbi:MAG: acyl-CoA dehydrogenase family protein [Actinobacteria bacterium]|nr:acyl-CoA dehydrogenase family protein [Actinomycetota bacterium]